MERKGGVREEDDGRRIERKKRKGRGEGGGKRIREKKEVGGNEAFGFSYVFSFL